MSTSSPSPSPTNLSDRIMDIYEDKQAFLIIAITFGVFFLCLISVWIVLCIERRRRRIILDNKRIKRIEKLHSTNKLQQKISIPPSSPTKQKKDIEMGEINIDKKKESSSQKKPKK